MIEVNGRHLVEPADVAALGLSGAIDAALIADGHDPECVTYVCREHRRHCCRITTPHTEHACWTCHTFGRAGDWPEEGG